MSKLYTTIDSDARKTKATSRGHKRITTHTACWGGAIRVTLWIDVDGTERYSVDRVAWQGDGGDAHPIAEGSFNEGSH